MIEIRINVDGEHIGYQFNHNETTLTETSLALHHILKIQNLLMEMEFEPDFEIEE